MLTRFFERNGEGSRSEAAAARMLRHSGGWDAIRKTLLAQQGLRILDVGLTSASNINQLTEMGQSVYMADLLQDAWSEEWRREPDAEGNRGWRDEEFVAANLNFAGRSFDVVLLWLTLDYLPEELLQPVVQRLHEVMVPGGQLLAFFHTKLMPDQSPYYRLHITPTDDIELQLAQPFRQQRALTNRNIERIFANWSGLKQFLAKDGVSESIIQR